MIKRKKFDIEQVVRQGISVCEDAKAEKMLVFDVGEKSVITDFYLICSGNSTTHVKAIMNRLQKTFREIDIDLRSIEGAASSQWIIMDYNNLIVHIFISEMREYYNIEALIDRSHQIYPDTPK